MMNPFVCDRYREGEGSWPVFHRGILQSLEAAARAPGESGEGAVTGRVIQVRAKRAGMGKSHLVSRLTEALRDDFELVNPAIRPGNLGEWERKWMKGGQKAGEERPRRLVVLDHLDAFYGDPGAGMRIARLVERYTAAHSGSVVVLAVNRDLWRNLFVAQLPSALLDLLTWEVRDLPLPSAGEAEGLVIHRLERAGLEDHVILQFLERLDLAGRLEQAGRRGLSPRELFRRARGLWESFAAGEAEDQEAIRRATVPFAGSLTGTEGPAGVVRTELGPMADQARSHLRAVADALRRQAGSPRPGRDSPFGAGPLRLLDAPGQGEVAAKEDGDRRVAAEEKREPVKTLPEYFQEARLRFLRQQPLDYRPETLFGLLRRVGERFPSIRQRIVNEELPVEERVLEWALFGRRIWIGVAPLSAQEVWERTQRAWNETARDGEPGKLAGFGVPGSDSKGAGVDVIELGADLLATLYAAEELARLSRSLAAATSEVRVTGFLASELDSFWSRLTRIPRRREAAQAAADPVEETALI